MEKIKIILGKPKFRTQCDCCENDIEVEIQFRTPHRNDSIFLCKSCLDELKKKLEDI